MKSLKKVTVFTGTRAEYGLLFYLLKDIQADPDLQLQLLVSGSHFSPEYGNTYTQIETDGFVIDEKVEMLLSSDSPSGVVKSMGVGLIGFADALSRLAPDIIVILGDRYEALAIAQAAMIMKIPILHLHGGEITEGAYDDAIRHAITKLSYLHATATESYRQRVIQLGEMPERVINTGALGIDNIMRSKLMPKAALAASLAIDASKPLLLVTYHPVTLANENPRDTCSAILSALDAFSEYQIIITYPNADNGSKAIIALIEQYATAHSERVKVIASLGMLRYLSAVKYATAVIGNSSSGIIEVPSFNVPTVNIGHRQFGREGASSVIHCGTTADEITHAIQQAINDYACAQAPTVNPYGTGNASEKVIAMIKSLTFIATKPFYNLPR